MIGCTVAMKLNTALHAPCTHLSCELQATRPFSRPLNIAHSCFQFSRGSGYTVTIESILCGISKFSVPHWLSAPLPWTRCYRLFGPVRINKQLVIRKSKKLTLAFHHHYITCIHTYIHIAIISMEDLTHKCVDFPRE